MKIYEGLVKFKHEYRETGVWNLDSGKWTKYFFVQIDIMSMWHKLCGPFHPWCPCIKTRWLCSLVWQCLNFLSDFFEISSWGYNSRIRYQCFRQWWKRMGDRSLLKVILDCILAWQPRWRRRNFLSCSHQSMAPPEADSARADSTRNNWKKMTVPMQ